MRINDKVIEIFESLKIIITQPESQGHLANDEHYNLIVSRYKLSAPDAFGVVDALFSYASHQKELFPSNNPIYDITRFFLKYYLKTEKLAVMDLVHGLLDEETDFLPDYRKTPFYKSFFDSYISGAKELLPKESIVINFWTLKVYKICVLETLLNTKRFLFLCSQSNKIEYLISVGFKILFKTLDDITDEKLKLIPEVYKKITTLSDILASPVLNIELNYGLFKESKKMLDLYYEKLELIAMVIRLFESDILLQAEKKNSYPYGMDIKKVSFIIKSLYEFAEIIKIFEKESTKNTFIQFIVNLNKANKHIGYNELLSNGKLLNKCINDIVDFDIKLSYIIRDVSKNNPQELIRLLDVKFEIEKYMFDKAEKYSQKSHCFLKRIFGHSSPETSSLSRNKRNISQMSFVPVVKGYFDSFFDNHSFYIDFIKKSYFLKKSVFYLALSVNRILFLLSSLIRFKMTFNTSY